MGFWEFWSQRSGSQFLWWFRLSQTNDFDKRRMFLHRWLLWI